MTFSVEIKNIFSDYDWVLRVLDSSETQNHLDCVLNCFKLWEDKYEIKTSNSEYKKTLKELRLKFWVLFKNKSTKCFKKV